MATSPQQPRRSHAVVTLLTTDSYLPGVLTSINSLLDVEASTNRDFDTVCLVTPATVGQASLKALQKTFDCVVGVAQIMTESWKELDLLGASCAVHSPSHHTRQGHWWFPQHVWGMRTTACAGPTPLSVSSRGGCAIGSRRGG